MLTAAMVGVLDNHGISHSDDIVNIITPLGMNGTAEYFIKLGLDMPLPEVKAEMLAALVPVYRDIVVEKQTVRDCLIKMRECGMHLHILTASPHAFLDPCLKRNELFELFDNVWSSDDFGTGKTDPNIYKEAAKRIGTDASSVVFLDDNINADLTAKGAGMPVIGVFDETSRESEAEMRRTLDGYVFDFAELWQLIEEGRI